MRNQMIMMTLITMMTVQRPRFIIMMCMMKIDLIPVESFESRNMNTIIREVFAQSALDTMQADRIGISLKSRMIGFEHDKWNVIDSML